MYFLETCLDSTIPLDQRIEKLKIILEMINAKTKVQRDSVSPTKSDS